MYEEVTVKLLGEDNDSSDLTDLRNYATECLPMSPQID
jgi:hypothetical protein